MYGPKKIWGTKKNLGPTKLQDYVRQLNKLSQPKFNQNHLLGTSQL